MSGALHNWESRLRNETEVYNTLSSFGHYSLINQKILSLLILTYTGCHRKSDKVISPQVSYMKNRLLGLLLPLHRNKKNSSLDIPVSLH